MVSVVLLWLVVVRRLMLDRGFSNMVSFVPEVLN